MLKLIDTLKTEVIFLAGAVLFTALLLSDEYGFRYLAHLGNQGVKVFMCTLP